MVVLSEPVCQALAETSITRYTNDSEELDDLVAVAMAVRDFSVGNNAAAMPTGEDYRTAITPDAIKHLLDVRVVFLGTGVATVLVFIALAVLVFLCVKRHGVQRLARPLVVGGGAPLAATGILAIAIAVDFSAFFTWMHSLFFASGTWTFPADSLLIRALPYEFWVSCAIVWAASMVLLCVISVVIGLVLARRLRSRSLSGSPSH